ncbi:MAG: metal-dependent hydrolase [Candidatus Hodarchaeota archaeon]
MDFFTHFLIGIFISINTLNSLPFSIALYAVIMAIIADFDILLAPLRLIIKSNFLSHKGLSHSYFTALIFSFFTAIIFTIITIEQFIIAWFVGFLFYSIHISLDLVTASKIPIFYPFSKKRYRFFIDRAINLVLALISGLVIVFYSLLYFFLPQLFFSYLFQYFFGFYLVYFLYRFISKIWIQAKLPPNTLYIPGLFPFIYFVYENQSFENILLFKLIKKYQFFSKEINLLEFKIEKGSKEMKFFEKAISLSKKYVFFNKWKCIIPFIQENKRNIIVILILAESYAFSNAYALKFIFDNNTYKCINETESFNYRTKSIRLKL